MSGLPDGIGLWLCRRGIIGFSGSFAVFPAFRAFFSLIIGGHQCVVNDSTGAFLSFYERILRWNLRRPVRRLRRIEFRLRFRCCCGNRTCLRYWLWYRRFRRNGILRKCPGNPQKHCKYACKVFHGPFSFSEQKLPILWRLFALKAFQKRTVGTCSGQPYLPLGPRTIHPQNA